MGAVFCAHLFLLSRMDLPLFDHLISEAYIMNTSLAIATYTLLYQLRNKMKTQLGFLFVLASFVKFALFFLFFNGPYKADGEVSVLEFTSFFVPYFLCLILELIAITKWLNKLDENTDQ